MFVLRKNAMTLNGRWVACSSDDSLAEVSLELVFLHPKSFQLKTFAHVGEAQRFISEQSRSWLCNSQTVICEVVFTPDGVTFQPIETQQPQGEKHVIKEPQ